MSLYFSIDYTGQYKSLQNFFTNQGWKFEMKNISSNRVLLKTTDECAEEIKYFANSQNEEGVKYNNV